MAWCMGETDVKRCSNGHCLQLFTRGYNSKYFWDKNLVRICSICLQHRLQSNVLMHCWLLVSIEQKNVVMDQRVLQFFEKNRTSQHGFYNSTQHNFCSTGTTCWQELQSCRKNSLFLMNFQSLDGCRSATIRTISTQREGRFPGKTKKKQKKSKRRWLWWWRLAIPGGSGSSAVRSLNIVQALQLIERNYETFTEQRSMCESPENIIVL